MAHLPHDASSMVSPTLSRASTALTSDTVVFSHTKAPSRQSSVVAGTASPVAAPATLIRDNSEPQLKKFRVEAPRGDEIRRMAVRVMKYGDKLGFGVRHDRYKRLQVSTIQGGASQLQVGDTLLSVNGKDLTDQEFLTVIQHLKVTRPGELVFEIERVGADTSNQQLLTLSTGAPDTKPRAATAVATATTLAQPLSANPWAAADVKASASTSPAFWPHNETSTDAGGQSMITRRNLSSIPAAVVHQTGVPPQSIPVTTATPAKAAQQPRKRARAAQRAVTMLDDNGQPVNVTALLADLKKERAEKAALEEKNAGLRKRLQRMLIENDEVRVRAKNEVCAAQEKATREIADAQNQLTTARAQLRLQDRAPNVARTDLITGQLKEYEAQVERLKKTEADRTLLLTTRYRAECRIAANDAQRVLDSVVGMFRTKLRQVGRMNRDNSSKTELEVMCDGVRRLAFMKLFRMTHDVTFYMSMAYHSQEPVRHTLEEEQFLDLFGHSLFHEERAGVYFVATAPMLVIFDPNAETLVLKCEWAEQNALRELARNFRF
ncbi:hypothetical protein V7S43_000742 [Phytophthora oleae]|uniref:PDZ domain-containing protein n=1 Tax=Phytophthora oleae TaxID=2107226 RepID=A0ABD3G9W0_9STRA